MKKILFPTDLSDVSVKGGAFAIAIAEKLNGEVLLYHATIQGVEEAEKQIKAVCDKLSKSTPVNCTYKVESGFPVSTIVEEVKSYKADLVAMATRGEDRDELQGIHLGSSAVAVMEKVDCPVLIIPPDSNYHDIKKMVLGLDIEKYSEETIQQAVQFASEFNSKLYILYVASTKSRLEKFTKVNEILAKSIKYNNVVFIAREGHNFMESIQEFVDEEKIDILIMTTYKRNALTGFFDKSKAKQIAYISEVPVLILKGK